MNSVSAPSQSKRPPEKGVFPLDHYGECKPKMQDFLSCIRQHNASHIDCKHLSKAYLECRIEKGLMQEEELDNLGFHEKGMQRTKLPSFEGRKEGEGFVAGLGVKTPRYKD
ncbi:hypothetical protein Poli38472_008456 [Pythium oligandrum]|uniref:CHCH domain-containing protein n=1 Tax=Pythium oligandrum TaxID=41045 RepID=A0A8K1C3R9_PYTOL|nr:hypothetical protein Poli38472_008456 [Pythium oligandrum]|eukprot:TMW55808.1 hypothetical protein Poli38472_008456 [Pythium oligandrum]